MNAGLLDCLTCGACCVHAGDVPVQPSDLTPRHLTRSVRNRMGWASYEAHDGVRRMDKHLGGRCKALKGEVGVSCRCGTYERRPEVCRQFPVGLDGCLAAREIMAHRLAQPERRPRGYGADWQATV